MNQVLDRWRLIGLLALVVIVVLIPIHVLRQNQLTRQPAAPVDLTFVGREECRACHQVEYDAWQGSDHDMAMDVANDMTVLGDFNDATFSSKGVTSRFYRREGKFLVHTDGPDGTLIEYEVTHVFGIEPLQQYLVPFPGGRLQCLTIAWDTELGEWFDLYPDIDIPAGDWLHWTGGGQNWNGMCAECHSTNLIKGYEVETDSFHTTWSEIDVSCEACHGPGSAHVSWAEIQPMARPEVANSALAVPTSDLETVEFVELCAPCHARRSIFGDYDHGAAPFLENMVPVTLDQDVYHADGQILQEDYVYGSFVQSKMFANDVSCRDCHDSHSLKLKEEGNALCLQCHLGDTYDSKDHHFHKKIHEGKPSDGALCVKCHMPEQAYMVIDERADHSIRIPRPDLSLAIGTPNACNQVGCHAQETVEWSVKHFEVWYGKARKPHFGTTLSAGREGVPSAQEDLIRLVGDELYPAMVRATALTLLINYPGPASDEAILRALADSDPLVRYTAVNQASAPDAQQFVDLLAPLLFDDVRTVRMMAASRLAIVPDDMLEAYQRDARDSATQEYLRAMEYSLDFSYAGFNLGNHFSALQDDQQAEFYYRRALAIDEIFIPAKVNLAMLLNRQGRNEEAEQQLREAFEAEPQMMDLAYSLGLLHAEMGNYREAEHYLTIAVEGMPDHPRAAANLAEIKAYLDRVGR